MRTTLLSLAALMFVATPIRADDEKKEEPKLGIGDKAPKLEFKEFVKGDEVKELAKGKVHVIEFWATWCAPCKISIPHLTELQKKHPEVVIVGVSAFEHDFAKVKPFVDEMGKRMEYRVALDSVPEGKDSAEGVMAKHWMDAAGLEGIPAAFIVNKDGVVAWIGHPKDLEKPLADVVGGTYDLKAAAVAFKTERARQQKLRTLASKIRKLQTTGDSKGIIEILESAIQDEPKLERIVGSLKFQALSQLGDTEKALAYGRKLLGDVYKDNAPQLNQLAWPIADPDNENKFDPKLVKFAVEAAKRACELTKHKDGGMLDTLACAYFRDGNVAEAIATQEKAIALLPDLDDLKRHLDLFNKALKKDKADK